jgi:hypothetical protein
MSYNAINEQVNGVSHTRVGSYAIAATSVKIEVWMARQIFLILHLLCFTTFCKAKSHKKANIAHNRNNCFIFRHWWISHCLDLASWYACLIKTNKMHFSFLICLNNLGKKILSSSSLLSKLSSIADQVLHILSLPIQANLVITAYKRHEKFVLHFGFIFVQHLHNVC